MPKALTITLTDAQRVELEQLRDQAPQAYLRERAAALLKMAAGQSASAVAHQGLLKVRYHETVGEWFKRYRDEGVAGLTIRAGRGRKPAFFPSVPDGRSSPRGAPPSSASSPRSRWANGHALDLSQPVGQL